jgi:hypothetical protein
MCRKRLAEKFFQIALLVFEIFEVDCPMVLIFCFWPELDSFKLSEELGWF